MSFLQALTLLLIQSVEGERTASSIFHLLKGKKSAQTIQDAHLYKLGKWFQTAAFLERKQFDSCVDALVSQGYLSINKTTNNAETTSAGKEKVASYFKARSGFEDIHGWELQDCAQLFWKRLSLLIQVASYFVHQERKYFPVTKDESVHLWLKSYLAAQQLSKNELAAELHRELHHFLEQRKEEEAIVFILRLSGKNHTGKTVQQAAELLELEEAEYYYCFLNILHSMIKTVLAKPAVYPLLAAAVEDIYKPMILTLSARRTGELLNRGFSVAAIMTERKLKRSTIEDHLVELALSAPQFSILPFVDEGKIQLILETAENLSKRKLKEIRDRIPEVSYFQIRLALAKYYGGEK